MIILLLGMVISTAVLSRGAGLEACFKSTGDCTEKNVGGDLADLGGDQHLPPGWVDVSLMAEGVVVIAQRHGPREGVGDVQRPAQVWGTFKDTA
ncbi:hypothetical protein CYMTET_33066, partial [Cymbomonas tetramitiformis]